MDIAKEQTKILTVNIYIFSINFFSHRTVKCRLYFHVGIIHFVIQSYIVSCLAFVVTEYNLTRLFMEGVRYFRRKTRYFMLLLTNYKMNK